MKEINPYNVFVEKTQDYLSYRAELSNYITEFFQQNGFGVLIELDDSPLIVIKHKLQRDKGFDTQVVGFYEVVDKLCDSLKLKITYNESRRWDTHLNMPIFGEEIVYLVGYDKNG